MSTNIKEKLGGHGYESLSITLFTFVVWILLTLHSDGTTDTELGCKKKLFLQPATYWGFIQLFSRAANITGL